MSPLRVHAHVCSDGPATSGKRPWCHQRRTFTPSGVDGRRRWHVRPSGHQLIQRRRIRRGDVHRPYRRRCHCVVVGTICLVLCGYDEMTCTGPAVGAYVGVSVGTYLLVHCGSRVLRCTAPAGGANSCVLGRQFSSTLRFRRDYVTVECWRSRRGNDVPSLVSEDKVRVWWQ